MRIRIHRIAENKKKNAWITSCQSLVIFVFSMLANPGRHAFTNPRAKVMKNLKLMSQHPRANWL